MSIGLVLGLFGKRRVYVCSENPVAGGLCSHGIHGAPLSIGAFPAFVMDFFALSFLGFWPDHVHIS